MNRFLKSLALAFCITLVLCSTSLSQPAPAETHGVALSHMDRSVVPGDDFLPLRNGDWVKNTELPADRGRIGVFSALDDISSKHTVEIIEEAAKSNAAPGTSARKIADLYNSYMNEAALEAKGIAPLAPKLAAISQIKDKHELARALASRCVPTSIRSTTPTSTPRTSSDSGSLPASTTPRVTTPISSRADWCCRPRILPGVQRPHA